MHREIATIYFIKGYGVNTNPYYLLLVSNIFSCLGCKQRIFIKVLLPTPIAVLTGFQNDELAQTHFAPIRLNDLQGNLLLAGSGVNNNPHTAKLVNWQLV